jgi:nucleotide-binding universal stress UspA family protein
MFPKILFPTDFSLHADKVLELIPDLKVAGMGDAVLLHVIDPIKAARWISMDEKVIEKIKVEAMERLEEIIGRLVSTYGMKAKHRVHVGVTYQEILNVANEEQISLIIMGTHGRSFTKRALLGSITQNVLRRTSIPLLIEKFQLIEREWKELLDFISSGIFTKILYPTDFSDNSLMALQMIKDLKNAGVEEIVVVHIQDTRKLIPHLKHKIEEFNRIDAERLSGIKKQLAFFGYKVKTILKEGIPFREINKIAEDENVSMIILGSHGKSAIKEVLAGSVTESTALHHIRPLMVIPRNWEA